MPELPEVETVRRGLAPFLEGARIVEVVLNRADLRFAFPEGFAERLRGRVVTRTGRRAKYLMFHLEDGGFVLSHLGMTGSYRFDEAGLVEPTRYHEVAQVQKHDHVRFHLSHPQHGPLVLHYADARRFGFMDFSESEEHSPYLRELGPEPLGNEFSAQQLAGRFSGRKAPIKAALLDQRNVAGLGNIYVSEALHRAHILPDRPAGDLVLASGEPSPALGDLSKAVREVLLEAIEAGGSTLRDFRQADGNTGYFQHSFAVYDREGEACPTSGCSGTIMRLVQSGRSSFYCPVCQH